MSLTDGQLYLASSQKVFYPNGLNNTESISPYGKYQIYPKDNLSWINNNNLSTYVYYLRNEPSDSASFNVDHWVFGLDTLSQEFLLMYSGELDNDHSNPTEVMAVGVNVEGNQDIYFPTGWTNRLHDQEFEMLLNDSMYQSKIFEDGEANLDYKITGGLDVVPHDIIHQFGPNGLNYPDMGGWEVQVEAEENSEFLYSFSNQPNPESLDYVDVEFGNRFNVSRYFVTGILDRLDIDYENELYFFIKKGARSLPDQSFSSREYDIASLETPEDPPPYIPPPTPTTTPSNTVTPSPTTTPFKTPTPTASQDTGPAVTPSATTTPSETSIPSDKVKYVDFEVQKRSKDILPPTPTPTTSPIYISSIQIDSLPQNLEVPVTSFLLESTSNGSTNYNSQFFYYQGVYSAADSSGNYIKLDNGVWKLYDSGDIYIDQISIDENLINLNGQTYISNARPTASELITIYNWQASDRRYYGGWGYIMFDGYVWSLYDLYNEEEAILTLTNSASFNDLVQGVSISYPNGATSLPTSTPTVTPYLTKTPTPTATLTSAITQTPTVTITPTSTITQTSTPTQTPTKTPTTTPSITITPSITPSLTPNLNKQINVTSLNGLDFPVNSFELISDSEGNESAAYIGKYYWDGIWGGPEEYSIDGSTNENYHIRLHEGVWKLYDSNSDFVDQISTDQDINNTKDQASILNSFSSDNYLGNYDWDVGVIQNSPSSDLVAFYANSFAYIIYDAGDGNWKLYDKYGADTSIAALTNSANIEDTIAGVSISIMISVSPTPTQTATPTITPTITSSSSSVDPTTTPTVTPTVTPTITPSSSSVDPTTTPTVTPTVTQTITPTATATPSSSLATSCDKMYDPGEVLWFYDPMQVLDPIEVSLSQWDASSCEWTVLALPDYITGYLALVEDLYLTNPNSSGPTPAVTPSSSPSASSADCSQCSFDDSNWPTDGSSPTYQSTYSVIWATATSCDNGCLYDVNYFDDSLNYGYGDYVTVNNVAEDDLSW